LNDISVTTQSQGWPELNRTMSPALLEGDSGQIMLTRALSTGAGSAVDPVACEATWAAWRLVGAAKVLAPGDAPAGAALLGHAVEALWVPGRTAWVAEVVSPGYRAAGGTVVHVAVGALGPAGSTRFESEAVSETIEALLKSPSSPYAAEPEDPRCFFDLGPGQLGHAALIRQRMVTICHPDGEISVLSRWHPTIDPWSGILRLLAERREPTRVRASVLATELSLDDHLGLENSLSTAQGMARQADQRADRSFELARATETLVDIKASFGSPLLAVEIAVSSPAPLADSTLRAIAAQFTSQGDVHRAPTHTVVAGLRAILGGYEIERDPSQLAEAHAAGLPLYGGIGARSLRDVVTLTESPIKWPLGGRAGIPTFPVVLRRHLFVPERLRSGRTLGRGHRGTPVGIPDDLIGSHCLLVGVTGSGKSTAMVAAALADLRSGRPFFFLDPHGTAADMLVRHAQAIGTELCVFDATDIATMRLSPVPALRADGANLDEVEAALAHFCDAVANNYTDPSWSGPRWLQQARAIAYISAAHGAPLSDALGWYADPQGRRLAAAHPALPGPVRQTLRLLDAPGNNDAASLIDWVTCKFEPLVTGPVGKLLAGPDAGARLCDLIRRGGPVIASLAGLPPSGTGIFGHILLAGVLDAAMARPASERPLFRLYVDEVHRFPARNLERAMNESRKFSVSVWAATQSLAVLGEQLGDTVIGATALKFVFRVSPDSALRMAPLLGVTADQLLEQPDRFCHFKAGESVTTVELPAYEPAPPRVEAVAGMAPAGCAGAGAAVCPPARPSGAEEAKPSRAHDPRQPLFLQLDQAMRALLVSAASSSPGHPGTIPHDQAGLTGAGPPNP